MSQIYASDVSDTVLFCEYKWLCLLIKENVGVIVVRLEPTISLCLLLKGEGGWTSHTIERVLNPGSDLINDILAPLSWYPGEYSIHYI